MKTLLGPFPSVRIGLVQKPFSRKRGKGIVVNPPRGI